MNKVYALARLAAVLVAIAGAFVVVPQAALILLVLGGIAGIAVDEDNRTRLYIVALTLSAISASKLLDTIPTAGSYLTAIVGGLAIAYGGAAIVAILVALALRIKNDWVGSAS